MKADEYAKGRGRSGGSKMTLEQIKHYLRAGESSAEGSLGQVTLSSLRSSVHENDYELEQLRKQVKRQRPQGEAAKSPNAKEAGELDRSHSILCIVGGAGNP